MLIFLWWFLDLFFSKNCVNWKFCWFFKINFFSILNDFLAWKFKIFIQEFSVKYWAFDIFHNRRCIRVLPYFFDCDAWEAFSWSSSNLISGAHQKATSTAALSEVRHQLTGAIVQEKRKTYSLARETLQTRRQHSTVSENQLKSLIWGTKIQTWFAVWITKKINLNFHAKIILKMKLFLELEKFAPKLG